ncbi:DUF7344 domain-containing protein [Natronorubrum aibiense]|uniref:Uncharacterized protein n=1 Tax=Natronorubrum aibiense TaxID=348826 RepID=A0A5P9P171_9EURY|nr:HalOD1 output domain-containing protein [Natronorubrum aibiense]QFU81875.1 hypothetical protein GCU68_04640 [Natronorubrum aibiense]
MRSENAPNPALDPVLKSLAEYRRRFVVGVLAERDEPVDSAELATALERYERETEGRTEGSTARIATELRHIHLPKLADAGVLDYRDRRVALRDDTAQALLNAVATVERGQRLEPMSTSAAGPAPATATRAEYRDEQERSLTDAILAAVADHRGDEFRWSDFDLCDELDPNSLNTLFRSDAVSETSVTLRTETVRIALWGDDGITIRVTDA